MELAGQMQRMLKNFRGLISSPRLNLIVFPALIGLLPMPGGAVFSAPMVKELGGGLKLSEAQLSFVNYWFRHIWEYWWPLYPGILLTTVITEINILTIMAIMCPFTAVALWLGYRALKRPDNFSKSRANLPNPPLWPFIKELAPILVVIFPGLAMGILTSKLFSGLMISKEIGLILALCAAIAWVWYQSGIVIAFLGSALPILLLLIQSLGKAQFLPAYVMLIIASGWESFCRRCTCVFSYPTSTSLFLLDQPTGTSGYPVFALSAPARPIFGYCTGAGAGSKVIYFF